MEEHFGRSLEDVRIHRDSDLAPRLGATAFTSGRDIHFAPGRFDPTSRSGTWLLAHELTHVEQQTGRIRRNGWFDSVVGTLDRAALRVRYVTSWDGPTLDSVIDHFGLERFKHLTDVVGAGPLAAIGAPTLLHAERDGSVRPPDVDVQAALRRRRGVGVADRNAAPGGLHRQPGRARHRVAGRSAAGHDAHAAPARRLPRAACRSSGC